MIKHLTVVLCLISVFYTNRVSGQDIHFTQFYASPLYLNPAFAGANVCSRLSLTYRNQWPAISQTYQTMMATFDHDLQFYNIGVGLLLAQDKAGSGSLTTTIVSPTVSYGLKVNREVMMRFGLQPGIIFKSVDFSKLTFGDQLANGGTNVPTVETPTSNQVLPDINASMLVYTKKFWGGLSLFHMLKPEQSLTGNTDSELPFKFSLHGGMKINLSGRGLEDLDYQSLSPAFNFRAQEKFSQLDIGLYYTKYLFNVGLWYRGIPVLKSYEPGRINNDAMAIVIGIQTERFNTGYSYDFTISGLSNKSGGAHELTLAYQFCKAKRKKSKFSLQVPCPKF